MSVKHYLNTVRKAGEKNAYIKQRDRKLKSAVLEVKGEESTNKLATYEKLVASVPMPAFFYKRNDQHLTVEAGEEWIRSDGRSNLSSGYKLGLVQKTLLMADEITPHGFDKDALMKEFMLDKICSKEASEKYGARVIITGNLKSESSRTLVRNFVRDNSGDNLVLAFEGEITQTAREFLESLPSNVDFIQLCEGGNITLKESVYRYMYQNHGHMGVGFMDRYLDQECERLFGFLHCKSLEVLLTDNLEMLEIVRRAKQHKVLHKIPVHFYDRPTTAMYSNSLILKRLCKGFDELVEYPSDYSKEAWENEICKGIYARLSNITLIGANVHTRMIADIELKSASDDCRLDGSFVLGSNMYDGEFVYNVVLEQTSTFKSGNILTRKYRVKAEFPNEEMKGWFATNVVHFGVNLEGQRLVVPALVGRKRGIFEDNICPIPGTEYVCEIKDVYRHYRFVIRTGLVTDRKKEKRKITAAWLFSKLVVNKPVVIYEKNCRGYEESGSVVFEKLIDMGYKNVHYIINRDAPKRKDIGEKYLPYVVDQFSWKHYTSLFAAKSILSSEALGHAIEKGTTNKLFIDNVMNGKKNYVFLQHGVMYMVALGSEQRNFFNKRNVKGKQRVVVSSKLEAEHFLEGAGYKEKDMYISGLPKFDRSVMNDDADRIMVMLTWRPWEAVVGMTDITKTSYYAFLKRIVESVPENLRDKLMVMPHPLVLEQVRDNLNDPVWKYHKADLGYDEALKQSKVLITDYSSIAYDAFYRGAEVLFCWEEKDACMSNYGSNAYLKLNDDNVFGDVCETGSKLTSSLERAYGGPRPSEYEDKYRRIVEFHDGKNAERLVEMIKADKII